jgi:hypothetical protein
VAAQWLNGARIAKATASHQRVVSIWRDLKELRALRTKLQEYGPDPQIWEEACRKLAEQRALVKAGKKGGEVQFPGGRGDTDSPAYKRLFRQTELLHSVVNEALCRYAFRPQVTYFVASEIWRGGLVPQDNPRWFQMKTQPSMHSPFQITVSEADAVMSLVRLDLIGEITKVRLCDMCQDVWLAARKSDQHCCSTQCREAFYAKHPDYHHRKATNQRGYRRRLKLIGL